MQELKFHVGNGLCYKMSCLRIVLNLQNLYSSEDDLPN